MIPIKFRFIWQSGFRGEDFLEINQSETRIVCGGHVCKRIGIKWAIFIEDHPRMLPTKSQFIWPSGFRGEDFWKSANQKQELPMATIFVNGSGQHKQSLERTFHRCFLPSFTSFGWGVSEEKIKMWKVNGRRTPSDGKSSHCLWQGELKRKKLLNTLKAVDFSCFLIQRDE
jgi:hypothetical protein